MFVSFSILIIDQNFKGVKRVATDLSSVLKKRRIFLSKVSKECFTYLAVGASFLMFFLRNTYFAAVSLIKRSSQIMPFFYGYCFFLFCFVVAFLTLSFLFGYGKVASFLFDWMQQQKHLTERTKKTSAGMVSMSRISEKKFEIENYSR